MADRQSARQPISLRERLETRGAETCVDGDPALDPPRAVNVARASTAASRLTAEPLRSRPARPRSSRPMRRWPAARSGPGHRKGRDRPADGASPAARQTPSAPDDPLGDRLGSAVTAGVDNENGHGGPSSRCAALSARLHPVAQTGKAGAGHNGRTADAVVIARLGIATSPRQRRRMEYDWRGAG